MVSKVALVISITRKHQTPKYSESVAQVIYRPEL